MIASSPEGSRTRQQVLSFWTWAFTCLLFDSDLISTICQSVDNDIFVTGFNLTILHEKHASTLPFAKVSFISLLLAAQCLEMCKSATSCLFGIFGCGFALAVPHRNTDLRWHALTVMFQGPGSVSLEQEVQVHLKLSQLSVVSLSSSPMK